MTKDDASNAFIRYWQIIVVMISFAAGYGSMSSDMRAMADDVKDQKVEVKQQAESDQNVKLSVVAIEKDIEFIKQAQTKQDQKLDKQDEKLDKIIDKLNED